MDSITTLAACPLSTRFDVAALRSTITTFRDAVRSHAERLNRLNVYPVPDGDTGTNMARTLDAVVAELDGRGSRADDHGRGDRHGSLMGARGNSASSSQIMRGLVSTLKDGLVEKAGVTASQVAEALQNASTAAYKAVLKPIEGTILTVVRESADAALEAAHDGASLAAVCAPPATPRRMSLDRTPELLPRSRTPASWMPAAPATCCCSTRRCTWSMASRSRPSRAASRRRPAAEVSSERHDARGITCTARRQRRRRRWRPPLRGDVLPRAARRPHRGVQVSPGERSAIRSWWSAATASGTATSTRTTSVPPSKRPSTLRQAEPDPRHRPVRGGRRRARPSGSSHRLG